MYHSGQAVAVFSRRQVESEWEHLKRLSRDFQEEHANLKDIYILFRFKNTVPPKGKHAAFCREILEFVGSKHHAVDAGTVLVEVLDWRK